ncbi:MAG TPA: tRNA 2-thiouridine(34) synthase MnmA, partial [Thermoanaerobaculia bacterium]|nr:tRNA 2-thiouridine(34) synthase MnmA [Thermoanaerobaculia bacterium]
AEQIGVPHYVVNLTERFTEAVVKPFVESYLAGETPIPCTVCNTDVKFKSLLDRAEALGCEAVATGHYARLETDAAGTSRLLKARDLSKDQTYFLWDLTPDQLRRSRFPLGDLKKSDVREIAREAGLPNWDKPDSQEVCFVPSGSGPAGFIRGEAEGLGISLPARVGAQPGPITDESGRLLGRHEGTFAYTVGQRRGLGIATGEALYVLDVLPEDGRVVVGAKESLERNVVSLRDVNFMGEEPLTGPRRVLARVRYRQPDQAATLEALDAPLRRGGRARLVFEDAVRAPAPGQSAVFFDASRPELMLGGGVITKS